MKLTAPPPPPPGEEPNDGPSEAQGPPSLSFVPPNVQGQLPPSIPQPEPETGPAKWPTWYARADFALAVLALLLGFMLASFVARNSDLWVHLAAGKRMVKGDYFPGGSDPFSYSGANRTWVNHSWLWDFGAYACYGGSGVFLVYLKALAIAAAGALLIGICRPGFPVWPWAAVMAVGWLAAAPRLTLSPAIASVLLLAALLFILLRVPHRPGSWRIPAVLGVLCWLWANLDAWFFLGPLTIGLVYAGEVLQRKYLELTDERSETDGPSPLGRFPDEQTLQRALLIGIAACCLTPHHIFVWQLPFELLGSDAIKVDPTMNAGLNLAPTDKLFFEQERLGYNLNGLAYAVLLGGGGLLLGVSAGFGTGAVRPRLAPVLLWIAFAGMSMVSVFAIPFLAVVAVPILAAQFNALSARVVLGERGERRTRLVLIGSSGGRVLCLIALIAACVCAWPGWMHPANADASGTRRVAWAVESDVALSRAATQIQQWHATGALPKDAHGMIVSIALADYCAWYAPDEKVFVNSRFQFHRPELPDYVAIRGALGIIERPDDAPNRRDVAALLKKHNAVYVAMYNSRGQVGTRSITQRGKGEFRSMWDILGWDEYATWYTDGRTLAFGWRAGAATAGVNQDRIEVDPVLLAFGPDVERLPPGRVAPLRPAPSWWQEFSRAPRVPSPDADEAFGWLEYKQALRERSALVHLSGTLLRLNVPAPSGIPVYPIVETGQTEFLVRNGRYVPPPLPDGTFHATPFLAVRAARRAIAANPDHPDGYYALALAISDPDLVLPDGERVIGQIIALRQCLDRMPPPDRFKPGQFSASPIAVAETLTRLYLGVTPDGRFGGIPLTVRPSTDAFTGLVRVVAGDPSGRLYQGPLIPYDLALKTLQRAIEYLPVEFRSAEPEVRKRIADGMNGQVKRLEDMVRAQFATYDQHRERMTTLNGRYPAALQLNLVGEAMRLLQESEDIGKDFGPVSRFVVVQLAALQLVVGRIEDANELLGVIRKELETANAADPNVQAARAAMRLLEYHLAVFAGNYSAAGTLLESLEGPAVMVRPPFPSPSQIFGPVLPVVAPVPGFEGPQGFASWLMPGLAQSQLLNYTGLQVAVLNQMEREASYYYVRGHLALLDGDIALAKQQFQQCFRSPPAGWQLKNMNRIEAIVYLDLIEKAERRAAPR